MFLAMSFGASDHVCPFLEQCAAAGSFALVRFRLELVLLQSTTQRSLNHWCLTSRTQEPSLSFGADFYPRAHDVHAGL